jgi:hypothetical protein
VTAHGEEEVDELRGRGADLVLPFLDAADRAAGLLSGAREDGGEPPLPRSVNAPAAS